jgi:ABC-type Zn uptake system ZnuABC Zn-binding protein ZnuA
MTFLLIVIAAIVLAVVYQRLSKKGSDTINQIKKNAADALDKIEPVLQEAGEVIEKAQKAMPKNKAIAKAATQVESVEATVKKARNKNIK